MTCDFWAENVEKKLRQTGKAIDSVASPLGFARAFGGAVSRFAAGVYAGLKPSSTLEATATAMAKWLADGFKSRPSPKCATDGAPGWLWLTKER